MILLLNYLPSFIFFSGVYIFYTIWKSKKPYTPEQRTTRLALTILIIVGLILGLQALTPHYLPKYKLPRSSVPKPVSTKGEIVNLQPQPVPGAQRDETRKDAYKERIEFVKQNQ